RDHPVKTLYESTAAAAGRPLASGDIVASLVPRPDGGIGADPAFPAGDASGGIELGTGRSYFPIARFAAAGQQWQLVVRGTSGSVEAAVRALHRRNLIVSFGVLLLLAIAMSLVVISAQAAHRLARAQMTFLAGVSHELRTPLTVICSAADNLADGTLAGLDQVKDYGNLIRDQGRRLSHMVNEVLSFTSGQSGRRVYRREPLDMAAVVEMALANLQAEIQSQRVTVEKSIEKELPLVLGDPSALTECVQNLVSNAVRYGGESRWLSIRVGRQHLHRRETVVVTVEDRGLGISPRDLPRVFEPFYRGTNATDAQIHGTGLGLSLAREIAKAMGGRLAVRSTAGKGSQFTLSLPAARP
ncbi:MAG: sensor histidine kinase, partial [Terriglobales bacterium]